MIRRVVVVAAAATVVAVALSTLTPGHAAPPTTADAADIARMRESVDYLMTEYRVTEAEALRRLRLQQRAPELVAAVRRQVGADLNDFWLDQRGGGRLVFASPRDEDVRRALGADYGADNIRIQKSRATAAEFQAAAERVQAQFDGRPDVRVSISYELDAIVVERAKRAAAGVDARARAAAGQGAVLLSFADQVPGPSAAGEQRACDIVVCDTPPMRGGLRLDVRRDDGSFGACTAGFNAKDSTGMRYVLTAGHCVLSDKLANPTYMYHNGLPVGVETGSGTVVSTYAEYLPGDPLNQRRDYAFVPFQVTGATNWVGYWVTNRTRRNLVRSQCSAPTANACTSKDFSITGIYTWEQIGTGWVVCATGSGTEDVYPEPNGNAVGTHCGDVKSKRMYDYYNETTLPGGVGLRVNICSRPGDSGGPLFSQVDNRAYGILSGGPPRSGSSCDLSHPNEYGVYMPISKILERINSRTGRTYSIITSATG